MADAYTGGRFVGTDQGWRWVPQNTAAQRLAAIEAARARGENPSVTALRNPLPVPIISPGIDAATNVFGAVTAGATNALPGLTRMLFGGEVNPSRTPARPAASAGTPAARTPQLRAPGAGAAATPSITLDPVARNLQLQGQVKGVFGNAVFSGGAGQVRTPADYDRLVSQGYHPVRGSRHETGDATDFNIPGMGAKDLPAVRANLRAAGVQFEDVIYHDNHFHMEMPKSGTTARASTAGPALAAPSPNDLMSFIRDPRQVAKIDLPDAPQREMPADRPTLKLADKEALLAPLREAMAIDPREKTNDAWERVQGMLQGMAGAAGQFSGDFAVGQLLAAAGGAGLGGFREVREEQRALDKEETEAERQVRIALAQQGYNIDVGNLDTENQNATINWQSGVDKQDTRYQNANDVFQTQLKELLTNTDIEQGNVGAYNQTNLARGQLGANALANQYEVGNQSAMAGWNVDQQGVQLEREIARRQALVGPAAPLLQKYGIPAERTTGETPQITNAREAANRIVAQGGNAGTAYLANEMLLDSTWDNGAYFDDATRSAIKSAIQQEKPEAAKLLILQKLQGNPQAVAALAQQLAASGSLVAQMMVQ